MKLEVIDAIWNKMLVTYGSEWSRKFGDQPLDEVKGAWADDLRGFTVEQIKYGLSMLGERPPNLIQFKDLCKKAPQYFDSLQLLQTNLQLSWLNLDQRQARRKLACYKKFYKGGDAI
jgi:hypothetical protein